MENIWQLTLFLLAVVAAVTLGYCYGCEGKPQPGLLKSDVDVEPDEDEDDEEEIRQSEKVLREVEILEDLYRRS